MSCIYTCCKPQYDVSFHTTEITQSDCSISKLPNGRAVILNLAEYKDVNRHEAMSEVAKLVAVDQPDTIQQDSRPVEYHILENYCKRRVTYVNGSAKSKSVNYEQDTEMAKFAADNIPTHKQAMLNALRIAVMQGELLIPLQVPLASKLVRELTNYRKGITTKTDNLLDALALSYYDYKDADESNHSSIIISNMKTGKSYFSQGGQKFTVTKGNYRIGDEHRRSVKTLW